MTRPTFTFRDAAEIVGGYTVDHKTEQGRAVMRGWLDSLPAPKPAPVRPNYATPEDAFRAINAEFELGCARPVSEPEAARVISIQRGIEARKAGA